MHKNLHQKHAIFSNWEKKRNDKMNFFQATSDIIQTAAQLKRMRECLFSEETQHKNTDLLMDYIHFHILHKTTC